MIARSLSNVKIKESNLFHKEIACGKNEYW